MTAAATIDLDTARIALSTTPGLAEITHPFQGGSHEFTHLKPTQTRLTDEVILTLGGEDYSLSGSAYASAVRQIPGASDTVADRWPIDLVVPALNFFFDHREGDFKALVDDQGNIRQFVKPSTLLFDPALVLDAMGEAIGAYGGKQNVVVKDFVHSLEETHFSVIVPAGQAERFVQARPGDVTVGGLYFTGSLLGAGKTELALYTDRVACSNGMVSPAGSARFRMGNAADGDEADGPMDRMLEWLTTTAQSLTTTAMDHEFARIQHLTEHVVDADHIGTTMADIFSRFSIPATMHAAIHEALAEEQDGTMYGIVQAITRAAQHAPQLTPRQRLSLMRNGGEVSYHAQHICDSCQRPMPAGITAGADAPEEA